MNHRQHKDGTPITDTDIEALADQADAGGAGGLRWVRRRPQSSRYGWTPNSSAPCCCVPPRNTSASPKSSGARSANTCKPAEHTAGSTSTPTRRGGTGSPAPSSSAGLPASTASTGARHDPQVHHGARPRAHGAQPEPPWNLNQSPARPPRRGPTRSRRQTSNNRAPTRLTCIGR